MTTVPAELKRQDYEVTWALCAMAAVVVIVFWQQFIGLGVFIGESDRLNSYLNIRLWEYDALRNLHRVPTWSNTMFGGFPTSALHWMNPGTDPIALLLQWFPRQSLFRVLGYVSIVLLIAASWSAYFYFRELVDDPIIAALGGLTYGLSVISLHRVAQVDNAHLTVVLLPVAFLALQQSERRLRSFVTLTLAMTALAFWGFLQEVAYAFMFIGVYAAFRACLLARRDRYGALNVVICFASASVISLLFAMPRLITVAGEMFEVSRTSTLQYYGYPQLLRFFQEGVYGRFFEEDRLIGNGMNVHEGLQLTASAALAIVVFHGILRPKTGWQTVAAALFCAMFLPLIHVLNFGHDTGLFSGLSVSIAGWALIILVAIAAFRRCESYLGVGMELSKLLPETARPPDTIFHLFAAIALLSMIVTLDGYRVIYHLFGDADFTHSRLSTVLVLSLCALFCIYLDELKTLPLVEKAHDLIRIPSPAIPFVAILSAGILAWLIHGPILDWLFAGTHFKAIRYEQYFLVNVVVLKFSLTVAALLSAMLFVLIRGAAGHDVRKAGARWIAAFVLVEVVTYANLKVGGPQTWTFPIPFRIFNYMNVPTTVMQPPSQRELDEFGSAFETDKYRAVLVGGEVKFNGSKTAYISSFWQMNSIGGYGTGVPNRLTMLPWPAGVQTLRTIEFQPGQAVDPAVLALLNVKYFIELNKDLYFNVSSPDGAASSQSQAPADTASKNIDGREIRYVENPVAPLPRHFLAASVSGVDSPPTFKATKAANSKDAADGSEGIIFGDALQDLLQHSFAEGFENTEEFDAQGPLTIIYQGDEIAIKVAPSDRERFVVLNMRYHPDWRIKLDGRNARPFPTNLTMMGVRLPAGTTDLKLKFEPLSSRLPARIIMALAVAGFVGMIGLLMKTKSSRELLMLFGINRI